MTSKYEEMAPVETVECVRLEKAIDFTNRIETTELPDDLDFSDLSYPERLAHIRHNFTNYEALLDDLPFPFSLEDGDVHCPCPVMEDICDSSERAYLLVKQAATDAARELFKRWMNEEKNIKRL